jgi:aspartate/methionine/tyrosine aminotransferase
MNKKLDLGYGNPGFLQELWHNNLIIEMNPKYMTYQSGKKNLPELENEIKDIHSHYKNAIINDKTKIVITVGAVQALQAALSYYKSKGYNKIYIPHPFWGRFEDFTNQANLIITDKPDADSFNLVTSPNNPDGKDQTHIDTQIRDACYNWDHYSDNTYCLNDEITVFSLSKLSGYSSSRIGWAVVKTPEIAEYMQNYVNIFTSGVSIESQLSAHLIIKHLNQNPELLIESRNILKKRKAIFQEIILNNKIPIKILSNDGMFCYIECSNELIEKLNIEVVGYSFFKDNNIHAFRLNIGTNTLVFNEFINRLKSF